MSTFCDAFGRLREELDQARANRVQTIQRVRTEIRQHARQTASELAQQADTRRAEFTAFMAGLRCHLESLCDETHSQLRGLSDDLRRAGAMFRRGRSTN
jgi:hypothetical protein